MKLIGCSLAALATFVSCAGESPLLHWKGEQLRAWKGNEHITALRVEDGCLKGRICGRDAQLYATVSPALAPKGSHVVGLRLKTNGGGSGQLFWVRTGDSGPSESRQRRMRFVGDGTMRDYKVRPGWCGPGAIRMLRLDLPENYGPDTTFALESVDIREEGEALSVEAEKTPFVAFTLKTQPKIVYGSLSWTCEGAGRGEFGFTTAPDGQPHDYCFDLRRARLLSGAERGKPSWKGKVAWFEALQPFADRELKVENLRFLATRPDTPPDPVLTSVFPNEAIPRAGRPFAVEAIVRNYGTQPVKNLKFAFDGLPRGVTVLEPNELAPSAELPGCDGTESIDNDCRNPLPHERVFVFHLSDLGVGHHALGLTITAEGVSPRRVAFVADVKPSLNLPKADYPPEPRPVNTAPYEIGALLFPGWTSHRWHAVWSHEPIRKPLLGWYDETKPETIDWQIKHLVENGVSFVSVDWYWSNGYQHLNHWMKAFAKARYRKYLKWHLMWDNGYNSPEDQANLTKFWCENYFGDPQYHKIGGKPVVAICSPQGMEFRTKASGGAKNLVAITQRIAKDYGFPGVCFVAMRGMGRDSEDPAFLRQFADYGFDITTVYGFRGGIPGTVEGALPRRSFRWMADVSPAHWRGLLKNGTLPFWPSLSTGYDDRPWRGERVLEIYDYTARDFARICREGRKFSDETGVRTFLMGPLDEWGEGSIGYPNREHGFGILEGVRDAFGIKPSTGWPLNYAPEDVGLVCPQDLR